MFVLALMSMNAIHRLIAIFVCGVRKERIEAAGDGRLDGQAILRYRMGKRHRTCVEHKRIPLVARAPNGASIQLVSKQGESKRCEMHSDLMFTSRQKLDIKQGKIWGVTIARPCCNDVDARLSGFAAL